MKLYETYDYKGQGYQKLFHFKSWRIAELKYIQEIDASPVNFLECHLESDEVFILLEGDCNMWLFTDNKPDSSFEFITLNKNEIYRIPQGIYHAHRLSKDAKILIIEEDSTNDKNSHR
ncbi:MAG: hypothetical protein WCR19_05655, partial [Acholeplasmataceae bacterium]